MRSVQTQRASDEQLHKAQWLFSVALVYIAMGGASAPANGAATVSSSAAVRVAYSASAAVASSFYALMRAAWTGATLRLPGTLPARKDAPKRVSLASLYDDFERRAFSVIPESERARVREALSHPKSDPLSRVLFPEGEDHSSFVELIERNEAMDFDSLPDPVEDSLYGPEPDGWDESTSITVEDLSDALREANEAVYGGLDDEIARFTEAVERAEREMREATEREQRRRADELAESRREDSRRAQRAFEKREAKREAVRRAKNAAAAAKAALQGARSVVQGTASNDKGAIGFVRVPHSPQPCAWCLTLASRGIMLYTERATASSPWHDGCLCSVEPVFSKEQYFESPLFLKNRTLHVLWDKHSDSDLNKFRRFMRARLEGTTLDQTMGREI